MFSHTIDMKNAAGTSTVCIAQRGGVFGLRAKAKRMERIKPAGGEQVQSYLLMSHEHIVLRYGILVVELYLCLRFYATAVSERDILKYELESLTYDDKQCS